MPPSALLTPVLTPAQVPRVSAPGVGTAASHAQLINAGQAMTQAAQPGAAPEAGFGASRLVFDDAATPAGAFEVPQAAEAPVQSLFSGEVLIKPDGLYTKVHYYEHPRTKQRVVVAGMNHAGDPEYFAEVGRRLAEAQAVVYEGSGGPHEPDPEGDAADLQAMAGTDLTAAYTAAMRAYFTQGEKSLGLASEWSSFDYQKPGWVSADKEFWERVEKDEALQAKMAGMDQVLAAVPDERKEAVVRHARDQLLSMARGEFTGRDLAESFVFLWSDPVLHDAVQEAYGKPRDVVALEVFDRVAARSGASVVGLKFGAAHIPHQRALLEERGYVLQGSVELRNTAFQPAPAPSPAAAAPDFGARNGTELANKGWVLPEVDRTLGVSRPPALEYIFVRPLSMLKLFGRGTGTNPYGHAAVRYTLPSGEQKVMNIVGASGRELVNFLKPEDYLYGTGVFDEGSEQGGVYNRGMVSVRVERLPDEQVLALDRFYEELKGRAETGDAKFSLALSDILNFMAILIPGHQAEQGNCARWTSKGLCEAALLSAPSLWPKLVWIKLYEAFKKRDPANVHVVSYRRIKHAVRTYGRGADPAGLVAPFRWWKARTYWDLERFADAVVEVPEGTMTALVARLARALGS